MKIRFLLGISLLISLSSFAQRGKNNSYTVPALNTVVNTYTSLSSNASVNQFSITVGSNTLTNSVLETPLSAGDLVLIIQMQGASMDVDLTATVNWGGNYTTPIGHTGDWASYLDLWGQVINYNDAGKYEYAQVSSVSGTSTINLTCGLKNNYNTAGKAQVIRVPRFENLSVPAGTSINPPAWNGTTGGVVAIEVNGNLTIGAGGKIEANAKGFRGGQQSDNTSATSGNGSVNDTPFPATSSSDQASEKGEGIGGYTTEYVALFSRYGVSAPANGGGGAHHHNAGGGGGSNVGFGTYTGKGVPSPTYTAIWNLENPPIGGTSSAGGGRGGYSNSASDQNEAVLGPNQLAWSGDFRRKNGGLGGHNLTFDATRIFMGGGGGAGDQNNNEGGAGGTGGGIVLLEIYGNLIGSDATTCLIEANGGDGVASNPNNLVATLNNKIGRDGGGGAGGGGAIIISHNGNFPATIGLNAKGGKGGNQNLSLGPLQSVNEANGPGGGGGGGQISVSAGTPIASVVGGANGVTTSTQISAFPPNGATGGGAGISNTISNFYDILVSNDTLCGPGSTTLTATVIGTLPAGATVSWYTNQFSGTAFHTGLTYTTPVLNANTTYYVGICPGEFRKPVQVVIGSNPTISGTPTISNVTCAGGDGSISGLTVSGGTPTYTYAWNGNASTSSNLSNANAGDYTLTVTDVNGCSASSGPHTILSAGGPVINTAAVVVSNSLCTSNTGSIVGITQSGGTSIQWSNNAGSNLDATNLAPGTYTLTVTDASNCSAVAGPFTIGLPAGPEISELNLVVQNATCGLANGTISGITSTGSGLTYSWTNTTQTTLNLTALAAGDYVLTVTDNAGCTDVSSVISVTQSSTPSIDVTNAVVSNATCTQNNGSIAGIVVSGGTNPLTYAWINTAQTSLSITNLAVGQYTLTVTDALGCQATTTPFSVSTINGPQINDLNVLIANESCTGNDGSISGITVSGTGLTYSWNGVVGTLNASNLTAGDYTLLVVDANGCSSTSGPYQVAGSVPLTIDVTNMVVTDSDCDANTASISGITITGGVSPVVSWSNNTSTLNQTNLGAGSYVLTVTDSQGCSATETVVIQNADSPVLNSSSMIVTQPSCGLSNGSISGITQPSGNVSITWSNTNQTTLDLSNLSAGSYTLTVTNDAGCSSTVAPVVLNPSSAPVADFTYLPSSVNPGDLVQFSDNSSTDVTTWSWTINGQGFTSENPTFQFVNEGTYTVNLMVTNAQGCNANITKLIQVFNTLIVPNVLTANNDGTNDTFVIKGLEPNTRVVLVNRWGNIVFESDNYLNDWAGFSSSGERLSSGVYTYFIKTPDGKSIQGFVHLFD